MNKQGFTLVEILIVMVIIGLGLMTVVPKIAENTILSNKTEEFFNEIIQTHLDLAKELNTQVFITGTKGSTHLRLHDGTTVDIPEDDVQTVMINDETTNNTEYRIYFYADGIFDHFSIQFRDKSVLEGIPALHKAVMR